MPIAHIDIMDGVFCSQHNPWYASLRQLQPMNKNFGRTSNDRWSGSLYQGPLPTGAKQPNGTFTKLFLICTANTTGYKRPKDGSRCCPKPHTNINLLEDTINDIDLVCVIAILDLGDKTFIENTYDKVRALKKLFFFYARKIAHTLIEMRWRSYL